MEENEEGEERERDGEERERERERDGDDDLIEVPCELTRKLSSEVEESAVLTLMKETVSEKPLLFDVFEPEDVVEFTHSLTVLELEEDEMVMQKGQEASFFGIVLKGSLKVNLAGGAVFTLPTSTIVGEMNYFDNGNRTATVLANESTTFAVLNYDDLEEMRKNKPSLACKVVECLAKASIDVLKKIAARAASSSGPKDDAIEQKSQSKKTKNSSHKTEMLMASRLVRQEKETLAQLGKEKTLRRKAEKNANNQKYVLMNRERRITELEKNEKEHLEELKRLSEYEKTTKKKMREDEEFMKRILLQRQELEETTAKMEKEIEGLKAEVEEWQTNKNDRDVKEITTLKEELVHANILISELKMQNGQGTNELRMSTHASKVKQQLDHEKERRMSAQGHLNSFKSILDSLVSKTSNEWEEITKETVEASVKSEDLRESLMYILRMRKQEKEAEKNIADLEMRVKDQLDALNRSKSDQAAAESVLDTLRRQKSDLASSLEVAEKAGEEKARKKENNFRDLLMRTMIRRYVDNFKWRSILRDAQKSLADAVNQMVAALSTDTLNDKHHQTVGVVPGVDPEMAMKHCEYFLARDTIPQIMARLKADSCHASVSSLELIKQKEHWKKTCNNFFHRGIELKGGQMELEGQLEKTKNEKAELEEKVQKMSRIIEKTMRKNHQMSDKNGPTTTKKEGFVARAKHASVVKTKNNEIASLQRRVKDLEILNASILSMARKERQNNKNGSDMTSLPQIGSPRGSEIGIRPNSTVSRVQMLLNKTADAYSRPSSSSASSSRPSSGRRSMGASPRNKIKRAGTMKNQRLESVTASSHSDDEEKTSSPPPRRATVTAVSPPSEAIKPVPSPRARR